MTFPLMIKTPEIPERVQGFINKLRTVLFYIALTTELVVVIIDKSDMTNPYVSYFFRFTFALTLLVVLFSRYTRRQRLAIFFFVLLGLFCYYVTGRNELLRFFIFIAACKEQDIGKALRYTFYLTLAGCIVIILLSVTGIFGNLTITQAFGGRNEAVTTRYSFGFGHPNAFQCMFFMLVLLGLYIYRGHVRIYAYLMIFIANFLVFLLTDSRTGFLIITMSLPMYYIAERYADRKWVYYGTMLVVLACVFFSVWAAENCQDTWYPESFIAKIDRLLNGRILSLYYNTKSHAGAIETWRSFSTRSSVSYFDMGWVRLFFWYGVVPGLVVIAMIAVLVVECYRHKDGACAAFIMAAAIYTIVEAHLVSVYIGRNYLVLIFGAYWYRAVYMREESPPPTGKTGI